MNIYIFMMPSDHNSKTSLIKYPKMPPKNSFIVPMFFNAYFEPEFYKITLRKIIKPEKRLGDVPHLFVIVNVKDKNDIDAFLVYLNEETSNALNLDKDFVELLLECKKFEECILEYMTEMEITPEDVDDINTYYDMIGDERYYPMITPIDDVFVEIITGKKSKKEKYMIIYF